MKPFFPFSVGSKSSWLYNISNAQASYCGYTSSSLPPTQCAWTRFLLARHPQNLRGISTEGTCVLFTLGTWLLLFSFNQGPTYITASTDVKGVFKSISNPNDSYSIYCHWKPDLTDKIKRSFFQSAVVSILLYGCTTWTLTKRLEKKLDGNYTRMLRAILNKSWRQHPTRHQLYGHLPSITKTIQVRITRQAGHCWRSRDELISDVLLWTPTYGRAKAGRPARTFIQQLCDDMGCCPEVMPEAMNDREKWRERVRDIRAGRMT